MTEQTSKDQAAQTHEPHQNDITLLNDKGEPVRVRLGGVFNG